MDVTETPVPILSERRLKRSDPRAIKARQLRFRRELLRFAGMRTPSPRISDDGLLEAYEALRKKGVRR